MEDRADIETKVVRMNIFLAPSLFWNLKRSVMSGVSINELDIRDSSLRKEIATRYRAGVIKIWALKEELHNRWASINEGDYVLFYHRGKLIYAGKVSFKYPFVVQPEQVEVGKRLAETIWGRDTDGKTWPYLFFLEDVREIDLPLSKFNELAGYKLRGIIGFMRMRKEKASKVINYLQQIYVKPPAKPTPKPPSLLQHEEIVDAIYALGELVGYKPEKKWRHKRYEFDIAWHKPPRVGPKHVFEVHVKGNLEAALLRLKHAYDLWESQIFLVSTEDQLKKARAKFVGELHELKDKLILLDIKSLEEFYNFKGRFEWLERKFGLRPR